MRTYLMPVRPYTIALRGMYYGRLGDDAEDEMLPALFLGYPGLVRGYDQYSFESSECVGGSTVGSCPAFDRLIGSRVAIANAELRFPIWGAFGGDQFYGPLPIEGAFFADAGVAWGQSLRAGTLPGDNKPVVSLGAAVRVNMLRLRGCRDRFRPSARSADARLDVAVPVQAGILVSRASGLQACSRALRYNASRTRCLERFCAKLEPRSSKP